MVRFDAGLFFASADALEDRLRELALVAEPKLETFVIDFEGVNFIDSQGAEKIGKVLDLIRAYGAELRLTRVKVDVLAVLERDGVIERLGADRVYDDVWGSIVDFMPDQAGPTAS